MEVNEIEVKESGAMNQVFKTTHIMLKILENCAESYRKQLFMMGTRSGQGDLKAFLRLRQVNHVFNRMMSMAMCREFKTITIDADASRYFIRCNDFTIARHRRPRVHHHPHRHEDDGHGSSSDESMSSSDDEAPPMAPEEEAVLRIAVIPPALVEQHIRHMQNLQANPGNDVEREEVVPVRNVEPQPGPPDDVADVECMSRFLRWLDRTFQPIVEQFTVIDSWSFKACSLPPSWIEKSLVVFNSMHPDMEACYCSQCVRTVRKCRRFYGPLSYDMAQEALVHQELSFGVLCVSDSFFADIAIGYTSFSAGQHRFDYDTFQELYSGIRCNDLKVAVQTMSPFRDESPRPQPLEIIQMLIKLWEIKSIQFDVIEFIDNDFYNARCNWTSSQLFTEAHFHNFRGNSFSEFHHVVPFQTKGTVDKDAVGDFLPIFCLRQDMDPPRVLSTLSLMSAVSSMSEPYDYQMQGRLAFHMFKANRFLFIDNGHVEFFGELQTANWLKYTIRNIMRVLWGTRAAPVRANGKTVYWIHYVTSLDSFTTRIWNEHMADLLRANFRSLTVTMNTAEAFTNCDNRTIATYGDLRVRPDSERGQIEPFYMTFHDPQRNNTTHLQIVRTEN